MARLFYLVGTLSVLLFFTLSHGEPADGEDGKESKTEKGIEKNVYNNTNCEEYATIKTVPFADEGEGYAEFYCEGQCRDDDECDAYVMDQNSKVCHLVSDCELGEEGASPNNTTYTFVEISWRDWSDWKPCEKEHGRCRRRRTRKCYTTDGLVTGGCSGPKKQYEKCDYKECKRKGEGGLMKTMHGGVCGRHFGPGRMLGPIFKWNDRHVPWAADLVPESDISGGKCFATWLTRMILITGTDCIKSKKTGHWLAKVDNDMVEIDRFVHHDSSGLSIVLLKGRLNFEPDRVVICSGRKFKVKPRTLCAIYGLKAELPDESDGTGEEELSEEEPSGEETDEAVTSGEDANSEEESVVAPEQAAATNETKGDVLEEALEGAAATNVDEETRELVNRLVHELDEIERNSDQENGVRRRKGGGRGPGGRGHGGRGPSPDGHDGKGPGGHGGGGGRGPGKGRPPPADAEHSPFIRHVARDERCPHHKKGSLCMKISREDKELNGGDYQDLCKVQRHLYCKKRTGWHLMGISPGVVEASECSDTFEFVPAKGIDKWINKIRKSLSAEDIKKILEDED